MPRIQFICQHCQRPFEAYNRQGGKPRQYCSPACSRAAKAALQTAVCRQCGTTFQGYLHSRKSLTYCSVACDKAAKATLQTATCEQCGKVFQGHLSPVRPILKYCSIACDKIAKQAQVPHTCPECGKSFTFYQSIPRVYCSKQCAGKHSIMIKNKPPKRPNARQRIVEGNKRGANWMSQKRQARHRDKYTCQRCLRTEQELGQTLHVHHVIPFRHFGLKRYKEANSLRNLICLCNSCHGKTEHDGWRLMP